MIGWASVAELGVAFPFESGVEEALVTQIESVANLWRIGKSGVVAIACIGFIQQERSSGFCLEEEAAYREILQPNFGWQHLQVLMVRCPTEDITVMGCE